MGIRTLTEAFYSFKNGCHIPCESLLERDFYLSLEFDKDVLSYKAQPVKVRKKGRKSPIFPDSLVTFTSHRPLLVEVKHTKDIEDRIKGPEIKEKAAICKEYAESQGWDFRIVTDKDVRCVRLENYNFLYKYTVPPALLPQYQNEIILAVRENGPMSITKVLEALSEDKMEKARALRCLWHLVRMGSIVADLDRPLTNSSIVEVSNGDASTRSR